MGCDARLFVDEDMGARWICYECKNEIRPGNASAHANCIRYDGDRRYLRVDFKCPAVEWR